MIINIRATNKQGDSFTFDNVNRIVNGLDLSGLQADVNTIKTTTAGSRYQNTVLNDREFDLEVQLRRLFNNEEEMDARRDRMYRVFTPEQNPIRFDFQTSNRESYYLNAYALHAPIMKPDAKNDNKAYQSALLQFTCPDPYIYQNFENVFELASYTGGLEFDWEIPEDGDMFEERVDSLEGNIFYSGSGEEGMNITFRALGTVTNPIITNAQNFEYIRFNLTLNTGDFITINTNRGNRKAVLNRSGVVSNAFGFIDFPGSSFITLRPGDNSFVYNADSGVENLVINIEYRIRKVGL